MELVRWGALYEQQAVGAKSKSPAKSALQRLSRTLTGGVATSRTDEHGAQVGDSGQQPGADEHGFGVKRGRRSRSRRSTASTQPALGSRRLEASTGLQRLSS